MSRAPRSPRPPSAPAPRPAPPAPSTTTTPHARRAGPPRRSAYCPVRLTPGERLALEQLAATPGAWGTNYPLERGDAARRLLLEALAARGVRVTEPAP